MFIFDTQSVKLVIDVSIEQNITLKPLLVFELYMYTLCGQIYVYVIS